MNEQQERDATQPSTDAVLGALDDETCRCILEETAREPLSASEIASACEVSSSTAYRKIRHLASAGLLAESTRVRVDGNHANQYRRSFAAVVVYPGEEGLEVSVLAEEWARGQPEGTGPAARTLPVEQANTDET